VGLPELTAAAGPPPADTDPDEYFGAWLRHHGLLAEEPPADGGGARTVTLSPRFALQGAAGLGVLAILIAFAGRPVYGVVTLVLVAAGCGALLGAWPALAARAPRALPRGRLLGITAIVPVLVVALVIVAILRHKHEQDGVKGAAVRDVRDANTALDEKNPHLATQLLARAETEDPHVPGIQTARARLVISQSTGRIRALEARIQRLKAERRGGR
jgi:hypothetical protein